MGRHEIKRTIIFLQSYIDDCRLPNWYAWIGLYGHKHRIDKAERRIKELELMLKPANIQK